MSPQDALVRAQELLDSGRAFAAHEVFEAVWKATDGDDRALWRGLAQLAVAITHGQRGNTRGASALFTRAAATLADVGADRHGVAVDALRAWARTRAADPAGERPAMPRIAEAGQAADDRA